LFLDQDIILPDESKQHQSSIPPNEENSTQTMDIDSQFLRGGSSVLTKNQTTSDFGEAPSSSSLGLGREAQLDRAPTRLNSFASSSCPSFGDLSKSDSELVFQKNQNSINLNLLKRSNNPSIESLIFGIKENFGQTGGGQSGGGQSGQSPTKKIQQQSQNSSFGQQSPKTPNNSFSVPPRLPPSIEILDDEDKDGGKKSPLPLSSSFRSSGAIPSITCHQSIPDTYGSGGTPGPHQPDSETPMSLSASFPIPTPSIEIIENPFGSSRGGTGKDTSFLFKSGESIEVIETTIFGAPGANRMKNQVQTTKIENSQNQNNQTNFGLSKGGSQAGGLGLGLSGLGGGRGQGSFTVGVGDLTERRIFGEKDKFSEESQDSEIRFGNHSIMDIDQEVEKHLQNQQKSTTTRDVSLPVATTTNVPDAPVHKTGGGPAAVVSGGLNKASSGMHALQPKQVTNQVTTPVAFKVEDTLPAIPKKEQTIPEGYVCPLSHQLFQDPVVASDGMSSYLPKSQSPPSSRL
jgi:hypothetical protein